MIDGEGLSTICVFLPDKTDPQQVELDCKYYWIEGEILYLAYDNREVIAVFKEWLFFRRYPLAAPVTK